MKRCPTCKSAKLVHEPIPHKLRLDLGGKYKVVTFESAVPGTRCASCGAVYLDGPSLGRFELLVAGELARTGTDTGPAFKFMRKALGMKAADLASLLGVAAETVSRWETETLPMNRGALVTLGDLVMDKLASRQDTLERLRALKEHPSLRRTVHVSFVPA